MVLRRTTHLYCIFCLESYDNYGAEKCWNCGKKGTCNITSALTRKTKAYDNIDVLCKYYVLYKAIDKYKIKFLHRYYSPDGKGAYNAKLRFKKRKLKK